MCSKQKKKIMQINGEKGEDSGVEIGLYFAWASTLFPHSSCVLSVYCESKEKKETAGSL